MCATKSMLTLYQFLMFVYYHCYFNICFRRIYKNFSSFSTKICVLQKRSVAKLTLRRLMSYIYMEHPFLIFLDHTQRRSTVGRTPLDE